MPERGMLCPEEDTRLRYESVAAQRISTCLRAESGYDYEPAVGGAFGQGEGEKGLGHALRRRQAARVFAREGAGAQAGADDTGIEQICAHPGLGDFAGVDLDQHLEAGLT